MSLHLVETSEEDSFLAVARYIGDLLADGQVSRQEIIKSLKEIYVPEYTALADTPGSKFISECEASLAAGNYLELLDHLVSQIGSLFSKVADKGDLESCLDIIVLVTPRITPEDWPSAAKKLTAAFTAEVDKHAEKRLSYLTDIFNAIPDGDVRFRVLLDAIEYAKKSGLAGSLAPVIKTHAEIWAKEWELKVEDERALYFACADLLRLSKKKKAGPLDAHRLTLKALSTYQGASAAELIAVKKNAAEAVADFIKFPDMFQFDLLEAEAVTQLRTDAEYGPLFKLLNILLKSTSIKEVEIFNKQHSEVLQKLGLAYDAVLVKARILALLCLASKSNELTFAAIKEALDLEEGQEEAWVIRASGKKLLEARIDQLRRIVTVQKLTHRTFTSSQWQELRAQLAAWKENVWSVKDLVSSQKDDGLSRGVPCSAPVTLRA